MEDREKIEEWFHLYSDDVYNFLVYYTGSLDVEDDVQEVFLKAFRSLPSYEQRAHPKAWLLTIARNLVIDKARKNKLLHFFSLNMLGFRGIKSNDQTPEKIVLENETLLEIYQAILSLKKSYKDILIARLILELSVEECSLLLNWNSSKVSLTYHRAIKALKAKLPSLEMGGFNDYEGINTVSKAFFKK